MVSVRVGYLTASFGRGLLGALGLWTIALAWPASPATAATPWPEFRGPAGDGVSADRGLPLTWSETEGVVWKTPLAGKAWASPVIWDGLVWLANATEDGKRLSAVAVDRATGRIVHDITVFEVATPQFCHPFNSYASCTPVIEAERIYLHYGSAGTACLDTSSGKLLWSRRDLPCDHFRGPGSSPILHGDLLIVAFDGFDLQYVVALDKRTGTTVWKTDRDIDYGTTDGDAKKAYPTGTVIRCEGREQIVLPSAGATVAYDPATGKELWRVRSGGMNASARPLFAHGLVFINTASGGMQMVAIRPDGAGDVSGTHVAWKSAQGAASRSSQLVLDDGIFIVANAGTAAVLDAQTGKAVWQKRLEGEFSASPILADGRIYAANQDGKTFVIAAAAPHAILATNALDDGCMASPAIYDGAVYLRTKTHLYKLAIGGGQ